MRVIAGRYGGRTLQAAVGTVTRPTSDRVREALFSALGQIDSARVLDLFAGSGALGIEALSRGAATCTFVDSAGAAISAIEANLAAIELQSEVIHGDALEFLDKAQRMGRDYDLVLLDPPYRQAGVLAGELADTLPAVLAHGARVVCESDRREPLDLSLSLDRERRYGDTLLRIYTAQ